MQWSAKRPKVESRVLSPTERRPAPERTPAPRSERPSDESIWNDRNEADRIRKLEAVRKQMRAIRSPNSPVSTLPVELMSSAASRVSVCTLPRSDRASRRICAVRRAQRAMVCVKRR